MGFGSGECWFNIFRFSAFGHQSAFVRAPARAWGRLLGWPFETGHETSIDKALPFSSFVLLWYANARHSNVDGDGHEPQRLQQPEKLSEDDFHSHGNDVNTAAGASQGIDNEHETHCHL